MRANIKKYLHRKHGRRNADEGKDERMSQMRVEDGRRPMSDFKLQLLRSTYIPASARDILRLCFGKLSETFLSHGTGR